MALLCAALGCSGPARPGAAGERPRVVSLHDVTTEMVVALGAGAQLVGIAELFDATPALHRAVAEIPRVGALETILAQRPTAVIGLAITAERDPELTRALRDAGIDVHLPALDSLEQVYRAIGAVADRVGAGAAGVRLAGDLRARIEEETATAARPVRVFVYDCCDPPFTAGGRTVLAELIRRAGGRNLFADLDAAWTHVSWEEVVARRPEFVLISAYRHAGQGEVADKRRALAAIPGLAGLPWAVLPLGCALGGLRSTEGLARLRRALRGHS
jgi:iron complex transport system substrate-binding protein